MGFSPVLVASGLQLPGWYYYTNVPHFCPTLKYFNIRNPRKHDFRGDTGLFSDDVRTCTDHGGSDLAADGHRDIACQ